MRIRRSILGKFLYALLFVGLIPLLLAIWAAESAPFASVPLPFSPIAGWLLALTGFSLTLAGIFTIMVKGDGLPMNAYPPRLYVACGIYALTSHPIYVGFCLLCAGTSLAYSSSSGFWLVTPSVILACTSLVLGYEWHDLRKRFGATLSKPLVALPALEDRPPLPRERLSVYLLVLMPWLLLYKIFGIAGLSVSGPSLLLPAEHSLPILAWTDISYLVVPVLVLATPMVARISRHLRSFATAALIGCGIGFLLSVSFPVRELTRIPTPPSFSIEIPWFGQTSGSPYLAFPCFPALWIVLVGFLLEHSLPRMKWVWRIVDSLLLISCILTGRFTILSVIAGALLAAAALRAREFWHLLLNLTEGMANSWTEWHLGRVRVINHGIYVGVGTCLGMLMIGTLLGQRYLGFAFMTAVSSLVCSGFWAQMIEGSPILLRPFGFYGGLLGVILGTTLSALLGANLWLLLGAFALAGPWIQAWGRLRCLIQGCCHGGPCRKEIGIRFTHPRSRVSRIAGLANQPLHPTQLYSILWNLVTGALLTRLWLAGSNPAMISGIYLILNGTGRFVEEAYRGEPQTPILGQLRLYQALAIGSVLLGAIVTCIDPKISFLPLQLDWATPPAALLFGILTWFAMGVDFPESNRRFSRLA